MAQKHPYVVGPGGLTKTITQLRKAFPQNFSATTLTKLGFAPNNETHVINTLRYLGLIDDKGDKTVEAGKIFSLHDDAKFQTALSERLKLAYADLFSLHADGAWTLSSNDLISFFRTSDGSSAIVGSRQASAFQTLASLAGKTSVTANPKSSRPRPRPVSRTSSGSKTAFSFPPVNASAPAPTPGSIPQVSGLGLTVRIEINLPAVPDQATYDAIFSSIRKNLIDLG